jgi:ribosomal protein S18 acetylase RimI-like enzyme
MSEIKAREGFVPEATWLVEHFSSSERHGEYCGTIQAVRTHRYRASIQNIGVLPRHRGLGIGRGLILASLLGMQQVGITQVALEVTAENDRAIELYRRLGFRSVRTLYKSVELATCPSGR